MFVNCDLLRLVSLTENEDNDPNAEFKRPEAYIRYVGE